MVKLNLPKDFQTIGVCEQSDNNKICLKGIFARVYGRYLINI